MKIGEVEIKLIGLKNEHVNPTILRRGEDKKWTASDLIPVPVSIYQINSETLELNVDDPQTELQWVVRTGLYPNEIKLIAAFNELILQPFNSGKLDDKSK